MATIDDLNKSISDMTREEINTLIAERRKNLRTRPAAKVAKEKAPKPEKILSMDAMMGGMTMKQKQELLAKLGGMV